MKLAIICFTANGLRLGEKLCLLISERTENKFSPDLYKTKKLKGKGTSFQNIYQLIREIFNKVDGIIFISACAIAVRVIAPSLKSKVTDPAVIVVDEKGKFSISLLSGHLGGANELAVWIAYLLSAVPVITTASDINQSFAVDIFAKKNYFYLVQPQHIKEITSRVLAGKKIGIQSDYLVSLKKYSNLFIQKLDKHDKQLEQIEAGICISCDKEKAPFPITLNLVPINLVLGIGCKKNIDCQSIEIAVKQVLAKLRYGIERVRKVCSIDRKKNEIGLLEFARKYKITTEFYTVEQLEQLSGKFTPSSFVKETIGIDNVCERCAVFGSQTGRLLLQKTIRDGVTIAIAEFEVKVCL